MHHTPNSEFDVAFVDDTAVRIHCATLFQTRQRGLCRAIADALIKQPKVRKAHINLDTADLQVDFIADADSPTIRANTIADAIQSALTDWNRAKRKPLSFLVRPKQWTTLTLYSTNHQLSKWETLSSENANRLLLQQTFPTLKRPEQMLLSDSLLNHPGILRCHTSPWWSQHIEVEFDPLSLDLQQLIDKAEHARLQLNVVKKTAPAGKQPLATPSVVLAATGRERFWFLLKAGASFVMTIIGVIAPGIPTMPFLVLTSYYLARSSPWLHAKLLNTHFVGDILRDWEEDYALSRASKIKLAKLLALVSAATLLVVPPTPLYWLLVAISVAISLYGIYSMPEAREIDYPDNVSFLQTTFLST